MLKIRFINKKKEEDLIRQMREILFSDFDTWNNVYLHLKTSEHPLEVQIEISRG